VGLKKPHYESKKKVFFGKKSFSGKKTDKKKFFLGKKKSFSGKKKIICFLKKCL